MMEKTIRIRKRICPEKLEREQINTKRKLDDDRTVHRESKRHRQKHTNLSSAKRALGSFYFLISSSPRAMARNYLHLLDWLKKAYHGDFLVTENPFKLDALPSRDMAESDVENWNELLEELNDPALLNNNWIKLSIINKILCIHPEEDWKPKNLVFIGFQRELWWIKKTQKWFDRFQCNTSQEYIETGMAALILELWYRFIWAHHTLYVHEILLKNFNQQQDLQHDLQNIILQPQAQVQLLELQQLQNQAQVQLLELQQHRSQPQLELQQIQSKVQLEQRQSSQQSELPVQQQEVIKLSSIESVDDDDILCTEDLGEGEDTGEEEEEDDESDEFECPVPESNVATESDMIVDNSMTNRADHQKNTIPREDNPDQEYNNQELEFEDGNHDSEEDIPENLPHVVPLFFSQNQILNIIDEIEAVVLGRENDWDISRAIDIFVQLVEHRNADLKVLCPPSRTDIQNKIEHLYEKEFKPFLEQVGICISTSNQFIWKWNPEFRQFLHSVFIPMFRNITSDGLVSHSRTFLQLFPKLFMLADPRTVASVSQVCANLQKILENRGKYSAEVDQLVKILDELLDEKNSLTKKESDDIAKIVPGWGSGVGGSTALFQKIRHLRKKRLVEIEETIETIKDRFHSLTGSVDCLEPKKRKKITCEKKETELVDVKAGEIEELMHAMEESTNMQEHINLDGTIDHNGKNVIKQ